MKTNMKLKILFKDFVPENKNLRYHKSAYKYVLINNELTFYKDINDLKLRKHMESRLEIICKLVESISNLRFDEACENSISFSAPKNSIYLFLIKNPDIADYEIYDHFGKKLRN